MDWWDQLRERLFGGQVAATGQLHHGPLVRNAQFAARHTVWAVGGEAARQRREVREWLEQERLHGDDPHLYLLDDAKVHAMQLERPAHWPDDALHHHLDDLRERVLELGYRPQLSDLRISTDGTQRERHYLKPEPQAAAVQDQRYGNILLEAWGPQDGARFLKVMATTYQDRNYSAARSGAELLDVLFG